MSTLLTPDQYLEIERKAECKNEYCAGEMFAMSGANATHCDLAWSLIVRLGRPIRSSNYTGYPSNMRLCVNATGLYAYPDVTVVRGESQFQDDQCDTLLNPTVVIEVHSPSRKAYNRSPKFEHYRLITSLSQYLRVHSERVSAELYTRQPSDQWLLTASSQMEDTVELTSVGCKLTVAEIYENVALT